MDDPVFLRRVMIRNYRSIAQCDVKLRALSLILGQNGAGKSNFLDALRFVSEALRSSLEHALRDRGGIKEVRRRSAGRPNNFGVRVFFTLRDGREGSYGFDIGARADEGYEVCHEECRIASASPLDAQAFFSVRSGTVDSSIATPPPASSDRLYLVTVAGYPEFRALYDALAGMGFYNLNPDRIRRLQESGAGSLLVRDGSNLARVLGNLEKHHPSVKKRIEEYLAIVVPGIEGVRRIELGPYETIEFRQDSNGLRRGPWSFPAANMSDGTLRVLGVLVALNQEANGSNGSVPLVGIEEPELALHPGAAGVLMESLVAASEHRQVLVTSHSPDLLDQDGVDPDSVIYVVCEDGATKLGSLDTASRKALKEHLSTTGELLRLGMLRIDPDSLPASTSQQMSLFSD